MDKTIGNALLRCGIRIEKNKLIISAARLLGLVYAVNPGNQLLFSDEAGNTIDFNPLDRAADCEKLQLIMRPTINHYSNGVTVIVDKSKPYVCKLEDFEDPNVLNAYRFCMTFAAHNEAEKTYGNKFVSNFYAETPEDSLAKIADFSRPEEV